MPADAPPHQCHHPRPAPPAEGLVIPELCLGPASHEVAPDRSKPGRVLAVSVWFCDDHIEENRGYWD